MPSTASSPATISEIEQTIQSGLEALRRAPLNDTITAALKFLIPEGFAPVVQLEEEGRKKRSNASASHWDPKKGEIVIYFEPIATARVARPQSAQPVATGRVAKQQVNEPAEATAEELKQCCDALAQAESEGKPFLSLKWFRDTALPSYSFPWTIAPASRQRVLTKAIESGVVVLGKIPNPKSIEFPTTTISLNRTSEGQDKDAEDWETVSVEE
ncbi:hypothetical protein [Edaphobacter bradus]|uniref:hypothetical protein n=1 Tax=Edaphobacter bradus TaxID=2259016 RepID=UPI0021E0222C|nr:hypothetical protein [Edaphobacter bradus]